MLPTKPTAFLVVHGIGEQDPFSTLDSFVRNFQPILQKDSPGKIEILHRAENREGWIDNYIQLKSDEKDDSFIDVYEYYWAHHPQRKVNLAEIVDWLVKTTNGARKFYEENNRLIDKYESDVKSEVFTGSSIKRRWYLKHLSWLVKLMAFIGIPKVPYVDQFIRKILGKGEKIFVDFVGDVVVYTSTNLKDKTFEIRKKILDGAFEQLKIILECGKYENIIVAGHSLGSVISYDAINKINNEMLFNDKLRECSGKLKGFITFGSPLDKIAFFFREHTLDEEYIRRQLLANYHNFKNKDLNLKSDTIRISTPYKAYLNHVKWLNFWNINDPVSGKLDFYDVDENIDIPLNNKWGVCHLEYWEHEEMYNRIIKEFFN